MLRRYRYDALDRLAGVKTGADDSASRFYQVNRLSVEVQGSEHRRVFQCEGQLLAEHGTEGSSARMDLLGTDLQRSVLHSVGSQARQPTAYSPYGHRSQGVTFLGFNGEPPDSVTGHYLLGNGLRAFNPVLMRFNQPDNLSPFGQGGLNTYAYCMGDPVNRRDPSGHIPVAATLSKVFTLQDLPNEILEQVFKHLPGKDLLSISRTSTRMDQIASNVSKAPKIDIEDPKALLKIQRDLNGETGLSPAGLKDDDFYRARIARAAISREKAMMDKVEYLDAQRKTYTESVMGRRANPIEFNSWIKQNRAAYAGSPEELQDIAVISTRYNELVSEQSKVLQQHSTSINLARNIRSMLNTR